MVVALHPGSVNSNRLRPFRGEARGRRPLGATADMLHVPDALTPADRGSFRSHNVAELPL